MGAMQRRKGKVGERELAKALGLVLGVDCRRGQQFKGSPESPDVAGVEGLHIEVKRCETLSLYKAMDQASSDAKEGQVPVVMHRRNGKDWLCVCRLEDLPKFGLAILASDMKSEEITGEA